MELYIVIREAPTTHGPQVTAVSRFYPDPLLAADELANHRAFAEQNHLPDTFYVARLERVESW